MKNKKIGAEKIRWDLSSMYKGAEDPKIRKDVSSLVKKMKKFHAFHKGNLANTLGEAIADYADITMLENKIMVYLFLCRSVNTSDAAVKAKKAETERTLNKASGDYLAFFYVEISKISGAALKRLYKNSAVAAKYRPWIEHIRVLRAHLLDEEIESALIKRAAFGSGAWSEFFEELESDLRFNFQGREKTLTEMLHLLTESKAADERSKAMKAVNSGLKGSFAKYSAQTLYMVTGSNAVENTERSYRHPMSPRNISNRISDRAVDALHDAVGSAGSVYAKRYYRLKAAHLGLKKLKWSDRNAPMPFADSVVVPFKDALKIVLEAYESFSPALAELIRAFVKQKRIDAPAIKGKQGGAFNCSVVLPDGDPVTFTFLNYLGSGRDVMTLAHELGHGVHGLLAGKAQGPIMNHAPIAFCETASIFGEMTTFNFLKKRLAEAGDQKSLLALIMSAIDDTINTAVRQIGFSNFERRLHGMDSSYEKWGTPKKYSVEEVNAIWLKTLKEMYGKDGDVFTYENTEHLWSYIPHFHRPFYVYGYAFGQLLTSGIYARQAALGDKFEPLYLDMLRSGSTKNAIELLKPFNINPEDKKFWTSSIETGLGALVKQAEKLSREMGVKVK